MFIAYADSAAGGSSGSWMSWIMIAVIFAALYFLTIRPQNKKEKELRNLRNSLKPGDEIITIGGIYGKIVRVTDDRVVIMVGSEKTKLEMAKSAISGFADPSAPTSSQPAAKTKAEETEKEAARPTPRTIKKLGASKAKEETAAEEISETEA